MQAIDFRNNFRARADCFANSSFQAAFRRPLNLNVGSHISVAL